MSKVSQLDVNGVRRRVDADAERSLLSVETALTEVDGAIERLENRDDETFQRYQEHIHRRRHG